MEILDTHYLYIQFSGMSLEFFDAVIVCWKHDFREN
jgi:hypothetical protein